MGFFSYSSCITIRTTVLVFCGIEKGNWLFKSLILVVNPWDCEHESDLYPCVHITFMNYKWNIEVMFYQFFSESCQLIQAGKKKKLGQTS